MGLENMKSGENIYSNKVPLIQEEAAENIFISDKKVLPFLLVTVHFVIV